MAARRGHRAVFCSWTSVPRSRESDAPKRAHVNPIVPHVESRSGNGVTSSPWRTESPPEASDPAPGRSAGNVGRRARDACGARSPRRATAARALRAGPRARAREEHAAPRSAPCSSSAAGRSATPRVASRSASARCGWARARPSCRSSPRSARSPPSSSRATTRRSRSRSSTEASPCSSRSRRRRSPSGSSPTSGRRHRRSPRRADASCSPRTRRASVAALFGGQLLVTPTGRRLNGVAELQSILDEVRESRVRREPRRRPRTGSTPPRCPSSTARERRSRP